MKTVIVGLILVCLIATGCGVQQSHSVTYQEIIYPDIGSYCHITFGEVAVYRFQSEPDVIEGGQMSDIFLRMDFNVGDLSVTFSDGQVYNLRVNGISCKVALASE